MGIPVMVIGESGSGKSTSLRNFKAGEIGIINVSKKPLPFRTDIKAVPTDNYAQIMDILRRAKTPSIAVDDASYLMVNEYMRTAKVTGYGKFTDMALNLWTLVTLVNEELPPERIVYFLGHLENDGNKEKFKTIGRMIDEKVTLEGMFTVVLRRSSRTDSTLRHADQRRTRNRWACSRTCTSRTTSRPWTTPSATSTVSARTRTPRRRRSK